MSKGGLVTTGYITTTSELDTYATHKDTLGKGGLHSVITIDQRDRITFERRSEGMLVYVLENRTTYKLLGGITNANWINNDIISCNLDYILEGDFENKAVPSASLIDVRLDILNIKNSSILTTFKHHYLPNAQVLSSIPTGFITVENGILDSTEPEFIITVPNDKIKNAQVLNVLSPGFLTLDSQAKLNTVSVLPENSLHLTQDYVYLGNDNNIAEEVPQIKLQNLPTFRTLDITSNFGINNLYTGQFVDIADPLNIGNAKTTMRIDTSNLPNLSKGKMYIGTVNALPPIITIDSIPPFVHIQGDLNWDPLGAIFDSHAVPKEVGLAPGTIFIGDTNVLNNGQITTTGLNPRRMFIGNDAIGASGQITTTGLPPKQFFYGDPVGTHDILTRLQFDFDNFPDGDASTIFTYNSLGKPRLVSLLDNQYLTAFDGVLIARTVVQNPNLSITKGGIPVGGNFEPDEFRLAFKEIAIGDSLGNFSKVTKIYEDNLPDLEDSFFWQGDIFNRPKPVKQLQVVNLPPLEYQYLWVGNESNQAQQELQIGVINLPNLAFKRLWTGDNTNRPIEVTILDIDNMANLSHGKFHVGDINNRPVEFTTNYKKILIGDLNNHVSAADKIFLENLPDLEYGHIYLGDLANRPDVASLGWKQLFIGDNSNRIQATTELYIDNMASLTVNKFWKGNALGRPEEADINFAPDSAKYIVQQPDANLPNAQALSTLATGLLKSTTISGVLSIAIAEQDYTTPQELNEQVQDLQSQIDTLETDLNNLQTELNNLSGRVTSAEGNITTLQGQVSTLQGQVSTLQTQLGVVQGELATLTGTVTALGTTVAGISTAVAGISATLYTPPTGLAIVVPALAVTVAALTLDLSALQLTVDAPITGLVSRMNSITGGALSSILPPKFIIQTPDSITPNAQALSLLSTGILKNNTGTGELSIAVGDTDYVIPSTFNSYVSSTDTILTNIANAFNSLSLSSLPSLAINDVNMNSQRLVNLQAGINPNDAVNKAQLDLAIDNAIDGDLAALSALNSTGYLSRVATDTYEQRTFVAGTGLSVTNGSGISGNTSYALSNTTVQADSYSWANFTVDAQGRLTSASSNNVLPINMLENYPDDNTKFLSGNGSWQTSVTSVGLTSNSTGFANISNTPITTSGDINIELTNQLNVFSSFAQTGIVVRVGSPAFTARQIVGSSDLINVTNNDGLGGNPTITIAQNPQFTGLAGIRIPGGVTSLRPTTPLNARLNTETNRFEYTIDGVQWLVSSNTVDVITLNGDVSGTGSSNITTTLANSIVRNNNFSFNYTTNELSYRTDNISDSAVKKIVNRVTQTVHTSGMSTTSGFGTSYVRRETVGGLDSIKFKRYLSALDINTDTGTEIYGCSGTGAINSNFLNVYTALQFPSQNANRRVVFYQDPIKDNEHEFAGIGINTSTLRVQLPDVNNNVIGYAATSSSTSNEVWQLKGNGDIIAAGTYYGRLHSGIYRMENNATGTNLTANIAAKINGVTTAGASINGFLMSTNNRLVNVGSAGWFSVTAMASFTSNSSITTLNQILIYKNGLPINSSLPVSSDTSNYSYGINAFAEILLGNNDYVEVYFLCNATRTITVRYLSLIATRI